MEATADGEEVEVAAEEQNLEEQFCEVVGEGCLRKKPKDGWFRAKRVPDLSPLISRNLI